MAHEIRGTNFWDTLYKVSVSLNYSNNLSGRQFWDSLFALREDVCLSAEYRFCACLTYTWQYIYCVILNNNAVN